MPPPQLPPTSPQTPSLHPPYPVLGKPLMRAKVATRGKFLRRFSPGTRADKHSSGQETGCASAIAAASRQMTAPTREEVGGAACRQALAADAGDIRAAGRELVLQPLEPTIEVIDPVDHGFALRR